MSTFLWFRKWNYLLLIPFLFCRSIYLNNVLLRLTKTDEVPYFQPKLEYAHPYVEMPRFSLAFWVVPIIDNVISFCWWKNKYFLLHLFIYLFLIEAGIFRHWCIIIFEDQLVLYLNLLNFSIKWKDVRSFWLNGSYNLRSLLL